MDVAFRTPKLREQEEEADHLGLLLMAESGFEPFAALESVVEVGGEGWRSEAELFEYAS